MDPSPRHPHLYMLVGLPGSGKSTYAKRFLDPRPIHSLTISTDKFIEAKARELGTTYGAIFESEIERATRLMKEECTRLFEERHSPLVWDQTNLNRKTRQKKLAIVPRDYSITCIYFELPFAVIEQRNMARGERGVPEGILRDMSFRYQRPTLDEGFTAVRPAPERF